MSQKLWARGWLLQMMSFDLLGQTPLFHEGYLVEEPEEL